MKTIQKNKYLIIGGLGLFVTLTYALLRQPQKSNNVPLGVSTKAEKNFDNIEKQALGAKKEPSRSKIVEVMVKEGFSEDEANYISDYCSTMKNGKRCAMLATAIADGETGVGTRGVGRSHKNNLFSIAGAYGYKTYVNRMASFEDWVTLYNRLWYKNNCEEMITKSGYVGPSAGDERRGDWINNCELTIVKFYQ